ncbi:RNA-binding protein 28-like [Condylostylus longicornis]|uniref:RNA-binding protein 28-like n=1 Tax=Condylostylus longicornis TaxID=2530218 RepID=UPI00244E48B0|nr:RNA-binding protein 28-like [Condylostylus longicornis]
MPEVRCSRIDYELYDAMCVSLKKIVDDESEDEEQLSEIDPEVEGNAARQQALEVLGLNEPEDDESDDDVMNGGTKMDEKNEQDVETEQGSTRSDSESIMDDEEIENEEIEKGKDEKKSFNDVDEGKTVHVRNIPFSATIEDIKAAFSSYGPIVYARVLKTPEGLSKGTAFVKFRDQSSALEVIEEDQRVGDRLLSFGNSRSKSRLPDFSDVPLEGLGVTICGRRVRTSLALNRQDANELAKERETSTVIKKNMHLMDIGYIGVDGKEAKVEANRFDQIEYLFAVCRECRRVTQEEEKISTRRRRLS